MNRARVSKLILSATLAATSMGFAGVAPVGANNPPPGETITDCEGYSDSVARLYVASFLRPAEQEGFDFWMVTYTSGTMSLEDIAEYFSGSPELVALYGNLTDAEYVERLYLNVLDRGSDPVGLAYWIDQMAGGMGRGTVLLRFTESPEFAAFTGTTPPADGYYGNGLAGMWACGVDHDDAADVSTAFAHAISEQNSTKVAILSAGQIDIIGASFPDVIANQVTAQHGHPADPDIPWCYNNGPGAFQCSFSIDVSGSASWTLELGLELEGFDTAGSPGTGRWIVSSYDLREHQYPE